MLGIRRLLGVVIIFIRFFFHHIGGGGVVAVVCLSACQCYFTAVNILDVITEVGSQGRQLPRKDREERREGLTKWRPREDDVRRGSVRCADIH